MSHLVESSRCEFINLVLIGFINHVFLGETTRICADM